MSQSLFRGSGVALVTPMTPDGIDFPALEQLIEWHIASGTDALILCATTGEGATLTMPNAPRSSSGPSGR